VAENTENSEHREPDDQSKNKQPRKLTPKERARRKRIIIIGIIVLVALILVGVAWYVIFDRGRESTDDAYTDGRAIGIAAKVSGYVRTLSVNDNQFVHAGDVLIEIDASDYRTALEQAQGQLAQAQAQLQSARLNLQVSRTAQPSDLVSAQAALTTAQANYQKSQADLARQREVDPRATTQSQTDTVSAQNSAAAAQVRDAQARVKTARLAPQNIAIAGSQVEALAAQVAVAEAQVQQAQLNIGYTQLRAPQDGRVTKRNVEMGSFVQPNQMLMDLVTPEIWITANFKEGQLTDMRPGQPVKVSVDAYPQLKLRGHVDSVQMGSGSRFTAFPTENATGNFVKVVQRVPVKIDIDDGLPRDWALPLGLSVVPTVDERTK